jgi:hypothetical protein
MNRKNGSGKSLMQRATEGPNTEPISLRDKTLEYWKLSRAWRGDPECAKGHTVGSLIHALGDLFSLTQNFGRLNNVVSFLLGAVIQGKRNRKTKALGNITYLKCPPRMNPCNEIPLPTHEHVELTNNG